MPRIFYPLNEESGFITITGDKAHYLTRVLRSKRGDNIEVLNGKGSSYQCVIKDISTKEIVLEVIGTKPCETESPLDLILLQGLLKGEKMDLVIQKTTELGVKEIVPVITERSQVRKTAKIERWRKIAEDASRQSGRTVIPVIHEPIGIERLFGSLGSGVRGFIFWEGGGIKIKEASSILDIRSGQPFYLLIGPEGGFTIDEVQRAQGCGLIPILMGRRIMRAETAAIVSTALVQSLIGDI